MEWGVYTIMMISRSETDVFCITVHYKLKLIESLFYSRYN